jgi:hypothetical protein
MPAAPSGRASVPGIAGRPRWWQRDEQRDGGERAAETMEPPGNEGPRGGGERHGNAAPRQWRLRLENERIVAA